MSGQFDDQNWYRRYLHFRRDIGFAIYNKLKHDRGVKSLADLEYNQRPTLTDFGAGVGLYVEMLKRLGCRTYGYDGTPNILEISGGMVVELDLSRPQTLPKTEYGMSIEVLEHIPFDQHDAYLNLISNTVTTGLFMSVATPGQRGRDHVACMTPEAVADSLTRFGWRLSAYTETLRKAVSRPFNRKIQYFERAS